MTRRLVMLVALAAALLGMLAPSPAAAASSSSLNLSPAALTLKQCIETRDRLSALFLLDESTSLRVRDREARRVEAAKAALAGVMALGSEQRARAADVDVLFASFASVVRPDPDGADVDRSWQPLTRQSFPRLRDELDAVARRQDRPNTDYANALLGARRLLDRRAAAVTSGGGRTPCRVIFWFTDGKYDLRARQPGSGLPTELPYAPGIKLDSDAGAAAARRAGERALCEPGGIRDSIATGGAVMFVVGLMKEEERADRDALESLTTGGGGACGRHASLENGAFVDVDESEGLFFAFIDLIEGPSEVSDIDTACVEPGCERGTDHFRLVPGLGGFVIRATTGMEGAAIVLRGPAGGTAQLRRGGPSSVDVDGVTVRQLWISERAVELRATTDSASTAWVGRWLYSVNAPKPDAHQDHDPIVRVKLLPDAVLELRAPKALLRGAPVNLEVGVKTRSDQYLRPAGATARVSTADRPPLSLPLTTTVDRLLSGAITVPDQVDALQGTIQATASYDDVDGIPVQPATGAWSLPIAIPAAQGYPTVDPAELSLPSLTGDGSRTGRIRVTASKDADGCVVIGAPKVDGPDGSAFSLTTTSAGRACIPIAAGQTKTIDVVLSSTQQSGRADGLIQGKVPLILRSSVHPGDRAVAVPVGAAYAHSRNAASLVAIVALLLVLGLGLPGALLWALNLWGSRLPKPQRLRAVDLPVIVTPGTSVRLPDGNEPAPDYFTDFENLGERGTTGSRRRVLELGPVEIRGVAARRVSDLFRGPFAVASAPGTPTAPLTGSLAQLDGGRRLRPGERQVPLGVGGTWLFVARSVSTSHDEDLAWLGSDDGAVAQVTGALVLVVAEGASRGRDALLANAQTELMSHDWSDAVMPEETSAAGPLGRVRRSIASLRRTAEPAPPPVSDAPASTAAPTLDDLLDDD